MNKIIKCNLQMFAEGDGAGFAAGSEGVNSPGEGQFATGTGTAGSDDAAERNARFNELINGEYKSEYQNSINSVISKRLKTNNRKLAQSEEFRGKVAPLLDKLAVKYAITDPNDIDAIMAAADKDNSYYEEYAAQHGTSVEDAKTLIEAQKIIAANEQQKADEAIQAEFRQKYDSWLNQAEMLKGYYPSFDFEYESQNDDTGETFRRYLNAGLTVKDAFELVHKDEIMGGAMSYAYQQAKQEAADARTARRNRPAENGTSYQQASAVNDDMSKLSEKDRQKIKAAVNRGEKVSPDNFRKYL